MLEKPCNVLFLCTGNSARSIMAECILARLGQDRFRAFSAGSHPRGKVHPLTLDLLNRRGYATNDVRSKGWEEFAQPEAPHMDFVITVCDSAAGEACPVWPGRPVTAHWSFPDPAAATGSEDEQRAFFSEVFERIQAQIAGFLALPLGSLDSAALAERLNELGRRLPEGA